VIGTRDSRWFSRLRLGSVLAVALFTIGAGSPAIAIATLHTVTFFQNASVNDPASTYQETNTVQNLKLVATFNPAFVKAGSTFVDWNTALNGSGTSFADGASYSFGADISLYAQWLLIPIGVADFVSNGGVGTIAPTSSQIGTSVSLPSGAGVTNFGYSFSGWNTKADGSGTAYVAGALYVLNSSTTLYAQWAPNVYSVNYSSDGGSAQAGAHFDYGSAPILLPTPTYAGYIFIGWFDSPTGGALMGGPGGSFTPAGSVVLYAQWTPSVYSVNYSSDGGDAMIGANFNYGSAPILLPTPMYVGYTFNGWYSSATGGALVGGPGAPFTPTGAVVLYAQWTQIAQFTLSFSANGGSGTIASITGLAGSSFTLPGQTGMLRAGFSLAHWNTAPKGTGTSYLPGQSLTVASTGVLYAQWTGRAPAVLYGAVGSFMRDSSKLTPSLKIQVNRLALLIKFKKYSRITLYGYTAPTGLASFNMSLSRSRAAVVAQYLRKRMSALHEKKVVIRTSGQGSVSGGNTSTYSRVEVFVS
jgi:uncharacterized repeat protein (TIGR02543 family)